MSSSAEEARDKGNNAFRNDDFDEAIQYYTEALELDPKDTLALSNRSVTYSRVKKLDEALADAKKVTEIQPDWAKAYLRLGVAYYNLDKKEEALEALSFEHFFSTLKDKV
jgi:tetratricopeptide (TPR) repeat protein